MTDHSSRPDVDVVMVGAGFAGIYGIHRFRDEMGLSVKAFEPARDVCGSWYWNRVPGARVDVDSTHYSYAFGTGLQREWQWSKRFPGESEIVSYLEHVASRLDIYPDVRFSTRVVSATWNQTAAVWHVTTDDGRSVTARYFVYGGGPLQPPATPECPQTGTAAGHPPATRFENSSDPLLALDITGRDGVRLADAWANGVRTYLGLAVSGFPNLFMVAGPQSPSVLFNLPLALEDHVDLIGDIVAAMARDGHTVVETSHQAEEQWVAHADAIAEMTLMPRAATSWHRGAAVTGQTPRALVYLGGVRRYRAMCDTVRTQHHGLRFTGTSSAELVGATV